jgi:5'-nucleotidase (lipoprotein e(P4) family)
MDLDETVLDNSGFQAMLVRSGLAWDPRLWKIWEKDWPNAVGSIPGAKDFIEKAKLSGVAVVFVTNRDKEFEQQTEDALKGLQIKYDLLKLKESGKSDDKTSRFEEVQQKYDVLLYVGDNLRDFSEEFKFIQLSENPTGAELQDAINERRHRVEGYASKWGTAQKPVWIVLPNPTYGEWTKPLGRGMRDLDRLVPEAKSSSPLSVSPFPPTPSHATQCVLKQSARLILGYTVSVICGALSISILVVSTAPKEQSKGKPLVLALLSGIADSFIYTTLFTVDLPIMIAFWLAFKVALQWKQTDAQASENSRTVLQGTPILLILAYVGAWIALWRMPLT